MTIFRYKAAFFALASLGACSRETADEDARSDIRQLKDEVAALRSDLDEERAKNKRVMNVMEANLLRRSSIQAPSPTGFSATHKALDEMEKDRLDRRVRTLEDQAFLRSQGADR